MTTLAITLPLARDSMTRIPRRDLVISASDDTVLAMTLVAADNPDAAPIDLSGLGPRVRVSIWYESLRWDYGMVALGPRAVQWAADAVISSDTPGLATLTIPRGSLANWGAARRSLLWAVQYDDGTALSTLAAGVIHAQAAVGLGDVSYDLLDSTDTPITTDGDVAVKA
jgi:hypothetical protein